ncbi:MAG: hypothetical protein FJ221_14540 [Lentisphaerae bacterium]|nr:hypothetical protein [Lentisphaerota bacterium]
MKPSPDRGRISVGMNRALAVVILGLVIAICVAVVLQVVRYRSLRDDLAAARHDLEEQKILHPLYLDIVQVLSNAPPVDRTHAVETPLARSEIVGVPDRFAKAATASGLMLGSVNPRVGEGRGGGRELHVDVKVSGPYARLKSFLQTVADWPCFVRIQQIEVLQEREPEEFRLAVRLALD